MSLQRLSVDEVAASPAHLLLLSRFCPYREVSDVLRDTRWASVFSNDVAQIISLFAHSGLLEDAQLPEKIAATFSAKELKEMLKKHGLKTSGTKSTVIARLVESAAEDMAEATLNTQVLRCTETGKALADAYVEHQRSAKAFAEQSTFLSLKAGDLAKAVETLIEFERSQVFPRGAGVDWSSAHSAAEMKRSVTSIFTSTPAILKRLQSHVLQDCRIGAGMMVLWGGNSAKQWLPMDFSTGSHLTADAVCRMLIFVTFNNQRPWQVSQDKSLDGFIKEFRIAAVLDSSTCHECLELNGKRFAPDSVPELPYAECTCPDGCRCLAVPVTVLDA